MQGEILYKGLKQIYPQADFMREIVLQDDSDGKGAYIAQWHLAIPQPTEADIQVAYEAAIQTEQQAETEKQTRMAAFQKTKDEAEQEWAALSKAPSLTPLEQSLLKQIEALRLRVAILEDQLGSSG